VQFLYVTVRELVADSDLMAMGMRLIADKYDMLASLGYMDLSVEAEAFGAQIVFSADEVPTIIGKLVGDEAAADRLAVPEVGAGRTGINVESIRKAQMLINDRPVFAQCIGPFSLAGRLMNVNDIMLHCYESPEMVHTVLRKATDFITAYALQLKEAGANGIIMAEPLAGLLSPQLVDEFFHRLRTGNRERRSGQALHYDLSQLRQRRPPSDGLHPGHRLLCLSFRRLGRYAENAGNGAEKLSCHGQHQPGEGFQRQLGRARPSGDIETPAQLRPIQQLVISSGCDLSPNVDLDNVDAFFKAVNGYYYRMSLWNVIS
jgi:uroporphyrinogen decarboxylase